MGDLQRDSCPDSEGQPFVGRCRLFLAIFPDEPAADLIVRMQDQLRVDLQLNDRQRPRDLLHVTLSFIGDFPGIPDSVIIEVCEICDRGFADEPPFYISFDHVESFRSHHGNHPFVLTNPGGNMHLRELHRRLAAQMEKPADSPIFNPHVTLCHHRHAVPRLEVAPVTWRAREIVLVLSHCGRTKYDKIASWTLKE